MTSDAQAAELGFVGSPTYLVHDEDPFEPVGPDHGFRVDACRAYGRPGGRIGPLPHRDGLMAALRAGCDRDA